MEREEKEREEKEKQNKQKQQQQEEEAEGEEKKQQNTEEKEQETALLESSSSLSSASRSSFSSSSLVPRLTPSDIDSALALYSSRSAALSGTIASLPNVRWADIGGLENVKREVMEAIELPIKFPKLFKNGIKKRAGILLYGPPGTGANNNGTTNTGRDKQPSASTVMCVADVFSPFISCFLFSLLLFSL